jgi:NAD(P)-dependent dehydrogenase (short-subunit alcohol dehydrogenase family)
VEDEMLLADKVAVITGGASGIGRAASLQFLAEGASVVVADLNATTGQAFLDLAGERGFSDRVRFVAADVSREEDVARIVETAVTEFGRLDCMFNNAGIPGALGPLDEVKVEDWDFTMAVLLRGPFLGVKHAVRQFKKQGDGGVILNTSSGSASGGGAGPRVYSIAKAGVEHLTTVAAVDLAPHRIRINAIAPGAILTEISGQSDAEAAERLSKAQPWPEHGLPSDIADAAVFLASDRARFITGQTLRVDGGLTADSGIERRLSRGESWGSISGLHHGTTGLKSELRRLKPS